MREYIKTILNSLKQRLYTIESRLGKVESTKPKELVFTGASKGKYDGTEALTVNIPGAPTWQIFHETTLTSDVYSTTFDLGSGRKKIRMLLYPPSGSSSVKFDNGIAIKAGAGSTYVNTSTAYFGGTAGLAIDIELYDNVIQIDWWQLRIYTAMYAPTDITSLNSGLYNYYGIDINAVYIIAYDSPIPKGTRIVFYEEAQL